MGSALLVLALVCRAQTAACFDAQATLTVDGKRVETHVTAEDLVGPGWPRSRYRLGPEAEPLLSPLLDQRTTALVCGNGLRLVARGGWRLEMRPIAPGVLAQLERGPSGCRTRAWTVHRLEGRLELLVEDLSP